MDTLINALREIVGTPDFYIEQSGYSSTWDYGAMLEYTCCIVLIIVTVVSVFKFLRALVR